MLTKIFFSALFLFIVFMLWNFWDDLKGPKAKTVEEKSTEEKKGAKVDLFFNFVWGYFILCFILGAVAVVVLFWVSIVGGNKTQNKPAVMMISPSYTNTNVQEGMMSWYKPVGVNGGNPNLRKFSTKAAVVRNNGSIVKFTIEYECDGGRHIAKFRDDGTWSQDYPRDGGRWHLNQISGSVFEGDHSDKYGSVIPMKLELI